MTTEEVAKLSDKPCPRCGCFLVQTFKCGCGQVHDEHCVNCGRFKNTLGPDQYVELSEVDAVCEAGPVPHVHSEEEKAERIRKFFEVAAQ